MRRSILVVFFLMAALTGRAEAGDFEFTGLVRLLSGAFHNPENRVIYEKSTDYTAGALARFIAGIDAGRILSIELNAYEFVYYASAGKGTSDVTGTTPGGAERSSALVWRQKKSSDSVALFVVDRAFARLNLQDVTVTAGRQPVNLAAAFYFTPNDYFAPFSAQTFFRLYKPGVDALRVDRALGPLAEFSLITVAGYSPDEGSSNNWSGRPGVKDTSVLARIAATLFGMGWTFSSGVVRDRWVVGGSLQGEPARGLDVRAEGHYEVPEDGSKDSALELTVGLGHSISADMDVKGELFYHGSGAASTGDYGTAAAIVTDGLPYIARAYLALGTGITVTPLLRVEGLLAANLVDGSFFTAAHALYSTSNESELSVNLLVPVGKDTPTGADRIESEFGLYPAAIVAEFRAFF